MSFILLLKTIYFFKCIEEVLFISTWQSQYCKRMNSFVSLVFKRSFIYLKVFIYFWKSIEEILFTLNHLFLGNISKDVLFTSNYLFLGNVLFTWMQKWLCSQTLFVRTRCVSERQKNQIIFLSNRFLIKLIRNLLEWKSQLVNWLV